MCFVLCVPSAILVVLCACGRKVTNFNYFNSANSLSSYKININIFSACFCLHCLVAYKVGPIFSEAVSFCDRLSCKANTTQQHYCFACCHVRIF